MNAATKTREPLHLTAEEAANRLYKTVANKPENWLKSEREIGDICKHLMARFIRSGLFVITN